MMNAEKSQVFTETEVAALARMKSQHGQTKDLLTESEIARLGFIRWLVQTGKVSGDTEPCASETCRVCKNGPLDAEEMSLFGECRACYWVRVQTVKE